MILEEFPANEKAQKMIGYLTPGWYQNSYFGKWLFQVMGIEMGEAEKYIQQLQEQAFPETATWGLPYHEQKYGIVPQPQKEELRRAAIINFRNSKAPTNVARLELILEGITGIPIRITENISAYTFLVGFQEADFPNLEEARRKVAELKPSHLAVVWAFLIADIQNNNQVQGRCRQRMKAGWWEGKGVELDGSYPLTGLVTLGSYNYVHPVRSASRLRVQGTIRNCASVVIFKNYWVLNGTYQLDGLQRLDAYMEKEEL